MRYEQAIKRLQHEVQCCPSRAHCPLAFVCGSTSRDGKIVLPTVQEANFDELIWADLSAHSRIMVIRSGVFLNKVYGNHDKELPNSLYGMGFLLGLTELFSSYVASEFFYLQTLVPGSICAFDVEFVSDKLGSMPMASSQAFAAQALLNQTTGMYGQMLTVAHRSAYDRTASVLARLNAVMARETGVRENVLPVSHADVAFIASIERTTASRELKRLAAEGFIGLGYRSIEVKSGLLDLCESFIEAGLPFYDPGTLVLA